MSKSLQIARKVLDRSKQQITIFILNLLANIRLLTKEKQRRTNSPKLTTPIGKLLEKTTYLSIAGCIIFILIGSSIYFYLLNSSGHGTNIKSLTWLDALYFSIITFSSLGYGDIAPIGGGKAVAALEVLFGLISIAVLVGKLASERQSALLLLIYTSEHQRRILALVEGVQILRTKLGESFVDHNHQALFNNSKNIYNSISSINNYLIYQSNEGVLATSGNTSSLRKLYREIIYTQVFLYKIIRTSHVEPRTLNYNTKALKKINLIGLAMLKFYSGDGETIGLLKEISNLELGIQQWHISVLSGEAQYKHRVEATEYLMAKVKGSLPPIPWPKNIHISIAEKLNIGTKLALRCVSSLKPIQ